MGEYAGLDNAGAGSSAAFLPPARGGAASIEADADIFDSSSSSGCPGNIPEKEPPKISGGAFAALDEGSWEDDEGDAMNSGGAQSPIALEAENFSLRGWYEKRLEELEIGFETEVLWLALNEIEEEQLGDDEVLKMWLGFSDE